MGFPWVHQKTIPASCRDKIYYGKETDSNEHD